MTHEYVCTSYDPSISSHEQLHHMYVHYDPASTDIRGHGQDQQVKSNPIFCLRLKCVAHPYVVSHREALVSSVQKCERRGQRGARYCKPGWAALDHMAFGLVNTMLWLSLRKVRMLTWLPGCLLSSLLCYLRHVGTSVLIQGQEMGLVSAEGIYIIILS